MAVTCNCACNVFSDGETQDYLNSLDEHESNLKIGVPTPSFPRPSNPSALAL